MVGHDARRLRCSSCVARRSKRSGWRGSVRRDRVPSFRALIVTDEIRSRTEATLLSLVVAVAAGIAGAYVTVRRKAAGALPGVAIAVALVPPLAASGILLRLGFRRLAIDAILLFVTNLCSIVLAASGVFVATGFIHAHGRRRGIATGLALPLIAVIAVTVPLQSHSSAAHSRGKEEQAFRSAIKSWLADRPMGVQKVAVARKSGYTQAVRRRRPETPTGHGDVGGRPGSSAASSRAGRRTLDAAQRGCRRSRALTDLRRIQSAPPLGRGGAGVLPIELRANVDVEQAPRRDSGEDASAGLDRPDEEHDRRAGDTR